MLGMRLEAQDVVAQWLKGSYMNHIKSSKSTPKSIKFRLKKGLGPRPGAWAYLFQRLGAFKTSFFWDFAIGAVRGREGI